MYIKDVFMGTFYAARVGRELHPVRLDKRSSLSSGFEGFSLSTGRHVKIRCAADILYEIDEMRLPNIVRKGSC
jgi:hypothetical protein